MKIRLALLGLLALCLAGGTPPTHATGQESSPRQVSAAISLYEGIAGLESTLHQRVQGIPTDWSHHHLVFSRPAPGSDAELRAHSDPRYWMQQIRRNLAAADLGWANPPISWKQISGPRRKPSLRRDWTQNLGGSGATVGAEMFPAKFSFTTGTTPNCDSATTPDFVVFNTGLPGSSSQASIIAFDNLYKTTCSGTVPLTYWAYNTAGGTANTSVILSLDGTQVAFVQAEAPGSKAHLILLKWKKADGTLTAPTTPTAASAATYRTCTAPCTLDIAFNGTPKDTNSAPFPDYSGDNIYVGADNGTLHKFTGVFNGTPAEAGSPWPVTVHSGTVLSSPVFDSGSSNIFVGDASGLASFVTSAGSLGATTVQVGATSSVIVDGPLVDSSTGKVFWFASLAQNSNPTLTDYVEQTSTALANPVTITEANANSTKSTGNMHAGAFDNQYFNSGDTMGVLYFCAVNPGFTNLPSLYRVGFTDSPTAGTMRGSPAAGALEIATTSASQECSPLTEFNNGSTDRAFVSVTSNGGRSGCSGACLYSFTITPVSATATVNSQPADGDTITVGSVTYTWHTVACTVGNAPCIASSASTSTDATNLAAAINNTCSSSTQCVISGGPNGSAAATASGSVTTITTIGSGTLALTESSSAHITLSTNPVAASFPTDSTAGLAASGGTSGIVVDNSSGSTGASQVYFSTLTGSTNQAVQASQSNLM